VRWWLDRRQRGSRESARHELAVEEQRIGRAVDEVAAVRLLVEHDPRGANRPPQERPRALVVDDLDPGQFHRDRDAAALDDERLPIGHAGHAGHGRVEAQRHQESDEGEENRFDHSRFS
jgi:hypothetical protein